MTDVVDLETGEVITDDTKLANGQRDELSTWAAPNDETDTAQDVEPKPPEEPSQLYFKNVEQFYDEYLRKIYRREINGRVRVWSASWYMNPEGLARLSAMWRSWEALRLDPTTGESVWWRDHADYHMQLLMDPEGPFGGEDAKQRENTCRRGSFLPYITSENLPELSDVVAEDVIILAAAQLQFEQVEQAPTGQGQELFFGNVAQFYSEYLRPRYSREINGRVRVWSATWWIYPEGIARLSAMWRAWESLRLDPATGMSVWWRDHADPHMRVLMDPEGPFGGEQAKDPGNTCKRGQLLPYEPVPPGMFSDARYQHE